GAGDHQRRPALVLDRLLLGGIQCKGQRPSVERADCGGKRGAGEDACQSTGGAREPETRGPRPTLAAHFTNSISRYFGSDQWRSSTSDSSLSAASRTSCMSGRMPRANVRHASSSSCCLCTHSSSAEILSVPSCTVSRPSASAVTRFP